MKSLPLRARRAALPLAVLAGFPCLPVAAQVSLAEPVELRPSVVTATRVETRADALLSDVTVIDGEELRNAPGRTLAEAVADCHLVLGCTARSQSAAADARVIDAQVLLFNAMGVISYTMTKLDMLAEAGMTPDQIAFMNAYPAWASAFWALGVWGAVAGSLLLLFRRTWAFAAYVVSLIGLAGSTAYTLTSEIPPEFATTGQLVFTAVIWASVIAMAAYARAMTRARVLL